MSDEPLDETAEDSYSAAQVRALIRQELAEANAAHLAEAASLRATIEAMQASMVGTVPVTIPKHGAGAHTNNEQTWSLFEQERARAAEHAATEAKLAA